MKEFTIEIGALALNFLDRVAQNMGDSYCDVVSNLCDMTGCDFDFEKCFADNKYCDRLARKCYKIILKNNPKELIYFADYYEEMKDYLRMDLIFYKPKDIYDTSTFYNNACFSAIPDFIKTLEEGEHPIIKAIEIIKSFIQNTGDEKAIAKMNTVEQYLLDVNLDIVYYGAEFASIFYQYLDAATFSKSNSAYTIGHIVCDSDTNVNHKTDKYVCHVEFLNRGGFAIFFGLDNKNKTIRIVEDIEEIVDSGNSRYIKHTLGKEIFSKIINNETTEMLSKECSNVLNSFAKK